VVWSSVLYEALLTGARTVPAESGLLASLPDPASKFVALTISVGPPGADPASVGTLTVAEDGGFTFTPPAGATVGKGVMWEVLVLAKDKSRVWRLGVFFRLGGAGRRSEGKGAPAGPRGRGVSRRAGQPGRCARLLAARTCRLPRPRRLLTYPPPHRPALRGPDPPVDGFTETVEMPRVNFTGLTVTTGANTSSNASSGGSAAAAEFAADTLGARRVWPAAKKGPRKYDAALLGDVMRTLQNSVIKGDEAGVTLQFTLKSAPKPCFAKFTKKSASALGGASTGAVVCKQCDRCLKKFPPGTNLDVQARANKKKGKIDGKKVVDGPWSEPFPFTA
jgi:hypothetical protein